MCLLCVIPPNVQPNEEYLINSAINNPDGYGYAILVPSEDRVIVHKSMVAEDSIMQFMADRKQYPESYALWHARLATHGTTDVSNCHPFQVNISKDDSLLNLNNQTWLAHNGILDVLEDNTNRSDTRIFAEEILTSMGGASALDNEQVFALLEDYSKGSKIVVLTLDPKAKQYCYILNEEDGWEDKEGTWWSNYSCKVVQYYSSYGWSGYNYDDEVADWENYNGKGTYATNKPTTSGSRYEDNEDFIKCEVCASWIDMEIAKAYYNFSCPTCDACLDCMVEWADCLCYTSNETLPPMKDTETFEEFYARSDEFYARYDRKKELEGKAIAKKAIEALTIVNSQKEALANATVAKNLTPLTIGSPQPLIIPDNKTINKYINELPKVESKKKTSATNAAWAV